MGNIGIDSSIVMVRRQMYIRPDQDEAIKRLAHRNGTSFAAVYRDFMDVALAFYAKLQEEDLPTNAGLVALEVLKQKTGVIEK